jgi:tetratricopeptide (TPR) repeat protein
MMKLRNSLLFSGALALATFANAEFKPENITPGEVALLPPYCIDTETMSDNDPRYAPRAKVWKQQLGETFLALHHYCWGLVRLSRGKRAGVSPQESQWHFSTAVREYQYVLDFAKPGFLLTPEIELRIGEAHLELKDYKSAVEAFSRSLNAKVDYWPAYERWAGVLSRLGKKREALQKLEEGIRIMPSEPALVLAYEKLGGNHKAYVKSLPPRVWVANQAQDQLVPPPESAANTPATPAASAAPGLAASAPQ